MRTIELCLSVLLFLSASLNCYFLRSPALNSFAAISLKLFPEQVRNPLPIQVFNGHSAEIKFGDSAATILYFVDPACAWCRKNKSSFQELWQTLLSKKIRCYIISSSFANLSLLIPPEFPAEQVVLSFSEGETKLLDIAEGTPKTILVSSKGEFRRKWLGSYSAAMLRDIVLSATELQ